MLSTLVRRPDRRPDFEPICSASAPLLSPILAVFAPPRILPNKRGGPFRVYRMWLSVLGAGDQLRVAPACLCPIAVRTMRKTLTFARKKRSFSPVRAGAYWAHFCSVSLHSLCNACGRLAVVNVFPGIEQVVPSHPQSRQGNVGGARASPKAR